MKKVFILSLLSFFILANITAEDYHYHNLLKTTVTADVLNIRELPTTKSKKTGKLHKGEEIYIAGFSDKRETIDGYNGYWVRIGTYNPKYKDYDFYAGWVFSKYVEIDQKIEVSTMKPLNFITEEHHGDILEVEINRNGKKSVIKTYPRKQDCQDFYTFRWNYDYFEPDEFSYTDPIGTFVYYPSTKEIKHITTYGDDGESAWNFFSDDFRYMFRDSGTGPGVRGLSVRDLITNEVIFSGSYLDDIEYEVNSIVIAEVDNSWSNCSEETVRRTEEFRKTKSPEELKWSEIVVRYRMDLKTLEKTFVDCKLRLAQ